MILARTRSMRFVGLLVVPILANCGSVADSQVDVEEHDAAADVLPDLARPDGMTGIEVDGALASREASADDAPVEAAVDALSNDGSSAEAADAAEEPCSSMQGEPCGSCGGKVRCDG